MEALETNHQPTVILASHQPLAEALASAFAPLTCSEALIFPPDQWVRSALECLRVCPADAEPEALWLELAPTTPGALTSAEVADRLARDVGWSAPATWYGVLPPLRARRLLHDMGREDDAPYLQLPPARLAAEGLPGPSVRGASRLKQRLRDAFSAAPEATTATSRACGAAIVGHWETALAAWPPPGTIPPPAAWWARQGAGLLRGLVGQPEAGVNADRERRDVAIHVLRLLSEAAGHSALP